MAQPITMQGHAPVLVMGYGHWPVPILRLPLRWLWSALTVKSAGGVKVNWLVRE